MRDCHNTAAHCCTYLRLSVLCCSCEYCMYVRMYVYVYIFMHVCHAHCMHVRTQHMLIDIAYNI